ncbi:MAG: PRC-barrel domain-containing protein [Thermanaeromonas sp.]|uniref:PRC-barrel domain-containing protein n=1 Tax=Thermanaeromonas sp. TaxID=2003697 RepID=UPI002437DC46|nr:PRC-barrel domain-containing protein [Thermanaeromonas sp.]MCG0277532.1 PRC-barrel domain-containing protein [Thermanaeromonas sp.]
MVKGRKLLGLPVINLAGEELGRIEDLIWEGGNLQLKGVLVSPARLFTGPRFLELREIQTCGPDALTVNKDQALSTGLPEGSLSWADFRGKRVLDTTGRELGILEDVEIEWPSGRVVKLEVSQGLVEDILNGRKLLDISGSTVTWGSDVVLLPAGVM